MGAFEERIWEGRFDPTLPRRDRRSGRYRVYIPDQLANATFSFDSAAHALLGGTLRGTMNGVARLLEAAIVADVDDRRQRKRIFEAREIIAAFTLLVAPGLSR